MRWLVALVVGAVVVAGCASDPGPKKRVGDSVSDITLLALDGREVALSAYHGKVVVYWSWGGRPSPAISGRSTRRS